MKKQSAPSSVDLFGDEVRATKDVDFAELFKASAQKERRLQVGESFDGELLSIGKEVSFISTGTMMDGQIPTRELKDKDGALLYKVGDRIRARVVRSKESELLVKLADSVSGGADDVESLEDAFDLELPIKGRVLEAVKGGFRVEIMGGKKAFCPFSQIDSRASSEADAYVGKTFEFILTQFDSRNMVVSRRKLLDLQRAEGEGTFMLAKKPGDRLRGVITKLEKFGAFCRLEEGLEGLIPISELAWGRVQDPAEVVRTGQSVEVILMRVLEEGERLKISLSLKQAGGEGDPWTTVRNKFAIGTKVSGTIERREPYGLFVNLAPGLTGLLPRSAWRDHVDGAQFENKKRGEAVTVRIDTIDEEARRMSLGVPGVDDDVSWRQDIASQSSGSKGLGTLGDLLTKMAGNKTAVQQPSAQANNRTVVGKGQPAKGLPKR